MAIAERLQTSADVPDIWDNEILFDNTPSRSYGRAITASFANVDEKELQALVLASEDGPIQKMFATYPLLTPELERDLFVSLAEGHTLEQATDAVFWDKVPENDVTKFRNVVADSHSISDLILYCNVRLVVKPAARFISTMPFTDLAQEGFMGIARAIEKFDINRGCKFSTYAMWWIRQAIRRAVQDKARVIRVPIQIQDDLGRVSGAANRFNSLNGRSPTSTELSQALLESYPDMSQTKADTLAVSYLNGTLRVAQCLSLDKPVRHGEEEGIYTRLLKDVIPDNEGERILETLEPGLDFASILCLIRKRLPRSKFSDREMTLFEIRFSDKKTTTLEKAGGVIGVTRQRARQIETDMLRALRHQTQLAGVLKGWVDPTNEGDDGLFEFNQYRNPNTLDWKTRLVDEARYQSFWKELSSAEQIMLTELAKSNFDYHKFTKAYPKAKDLEEEQFKLFARAAFRHLVEAKIDWIKAGEN
ncbi:MAG: sigma-70 family RNA polymerase sigma factor [Candidatus Blackburnbacteria bacterium]|nr:sigma-70 family RNA polymerase sigma factor [Candidatus Blackburnbacteria bacterium]